MKTLKQRFKRRGLASWLFCTAQFDDVSYLRSSATAVHHQLPPVSKREWLVSEIRTQASRPTRSARSARSPPMPTPPQAILISSHGVVI
jgi:hypothetical protein